MFSSSSSSSSSSFFFSLRKRLGERVPGVVLVEQGSSELERHGARDCTLADARKAAEEDEDGGGGRAAGGGGGAGGPRPGGARVGVGRRIVGISFLGLVILGVSCSVLPIGHWPAGDKRERETGSLKLECTALCDDARESQPASAGSGRSLEKKGKAEFWFSESCSVRIEKKSFTFNIDRLPNFPIMDSDLLASVASQLVENGGILASDESPPTLGKRLVKAGLENDEVSRLVCFFCFFSFLFLPSKLQKPRPRLRKKKNVSKGNPLRLALVPLRRQPLRQRHPRLHRLRGGL